MGNLLAAKLLNFPESNKNDCEKCPEAEKEAILMPPVVTSSSNFQEVASIITFQSHLVIQGQLLTVISWQLNCYHCRSQDKVMRMRMMHMTIRVARARVQKLKEKKKKA